MRKWEGIMILFMVVTFLGTTLSTASTSEMRCFNSETHLSWETSDGYVVEMVWNKTFGGRDSDVALSLEETPDGYIIAGYTYSYGAGNSRWSDAWLIKTDFNGNEVWNKTCGGSSFDEGYLVEEMVDGYIIVGSTSSYGAGYDDVWLIKTDFNGSKVWDQTFGTSTVEEGYSVQQTLNGYMVAGYTCSWTGYTDAWLIKCRLTRLGDVDRDGDVDFRDLLGILLLILNPWS